MGFPRSSAGKESACNAGDLGSIPGLGRFPGEGNGYLLQYSYVENSMDRRAWRATVHEVTKDTIDMTEWLMLSLSHWPPKSVQLSSDSCSVWTVFCFYIPCHSIMLGQPSCRGDRVVREDSRLETVITPCQFYWRINVSYDSNIFQLHISTWNSAPEIVTFRRWKN